MQTLNKDFLRSFWEDIDLIYDNNHKEGIKPRELLKIIIKHQKQLKGKKVKFEKMSPYISQITSRFKKALLSQDRFQVMFNWNNRKKRIEIEFNLRILDILVSMEHIIFQEETEYQTKKIIIFLNNI